MKKARLLVPVSVIAAVVLLLMAPAGALAAPNQHGGEHPGGHDGWHDDWNGDWDSSCHGDWHDDCRGDWDDDYYSDWDDDCYGGFTYIVRCGDTLGDIGWRYGSSALELARVNDIHNPNVIYAGQRLWIPAGCW
jgi:hypothetical protein